MIWTTFLLFISLILPGHFADNIPSLPYCPEDHDSGLIIVSTLDGKLSALNLNGSLKWEVNTDPGPLLLSNIHTLELTDNGEWIRIIPSLTGMLYKFDGFSVDPIPISAEDLLKSSFLYSSDLVIAGGLEVRTYGVGFRTGTLFYECNSLKCLNNNNNDDDVLLIERSTRVIRAVEPRSGTEKWNFSVGMHNVKLPTLSCHNEKIGYKWNFTTIIPEGKLCVTIQFDHGEERNWNYHFSSPIVRMWKWTGNALEEVDIFTLKNTLQLVGSTIPPSLYIGMHLRQLYIHESIEMQKHVENLLTGKMDSNLVVAETTSIVKIPWKPIPASKVTFEGDSTSLSVLNGSEYVNGHGFYLHAHKPMILCDSNTSYVKNLTNGKYFLFNNIELIFNWWKEFFLLVITLFICNVLFRYWNQQPKDQEIIIIEKPVDAQISMPEENVEKKNNFVSRFENDFETTRCLGHGGFGVVFEVKQKIDECNYAIKRIVLPNEAKSRDRVMREVKALAKLEHQNIVRYFCSWVENPPMGWQQNHDKQWIKDDKSLNFFGPSTDKKTKRSKSVSVSIDIPLNSINSVVSQHFDEDSDDSFIVFEKTNESTEEKKEVISNNSLVSNTASEHIKKKIDWRRPNRKHYSWDLSFSNNQVLKQQKKPPVYLYIQMQLCQKESLKDWLSTNLTRDYNIVTNIFLQILEAVEYVHLRGLIHRDLKPSNIFFALDGQIKVGDFGLVKDVEEAIDLELIKQGTPPAYRGHTLEVGTQLYMSPEQSNCGIYDYKVDIYALGLIFFELLVSFSTDMERIKMLTNVKNHKYPINFKEKFSQEYNLLQNMICEDPNKRLTTIGIKARPPFNIETGYPGEDCHYRLNGFVKN